MSLDAHIEIDVLDRFASGRLEEADRSTAEQHLGGCESCRVRLGEIAGHLELAGTLRASSPRFEPLPESVGRYRILREIGRGGMGIVFEAEQTRPHRRVALKALGSSHLAGAEIERMLRREAQALARLEHPSVARIYDVGHMPDGRPYIAMEFVDGPTLTRYVEQHSPSRRARLLLFVELCDAVAHAHQRGVIHRDLKPSNVLVDRSGRPRVLDFGLARLVEVEGEPSLSLSVDVGRIRGTLPYMSPEQVRGDEHAIDARSDLYSLGVILYVLLLERLPYALSPGNLPEAVRVICEREPDRPSVLDRTLRGDLETILLHALRKDPGQRYATVAALRDDLLRYLERQPILARSPSLAYQLGKLVQRHTLFFATAAVVFVAAIVVGVWTSALYRDARLQRQISTNTAREKQAEATRAQTMVDLLQKMLGSADVHEAKGADYTVRELLDEFAGDFGTRLRDQPDVEASLRTTIARAYLSLGLPEDATKHIEAALALHRERPVPDDVEIVYLVEQRAWCAHEQGRYEDAEREFRDVLAERVRLFGPTDASVARAQYYLGDVLRHRGDSSDAESMARESLATFEALADEDDPERIATLSLLGQLLQDRGELAEARTRFRDGLERSIRINGGRDRTTATLLNNLGALYYWQGDYEGANQSYERALEIRRELIGRDHPEIARVLNNLGDLRRNQGRFAEAVDLLRQSLEMRRRILPSDHPDMAQSLNNLALAVYSTGDLDRAIQCTREAVDIRRATSGEWNPALATAIVNLASLLRTHGDFEEAIELCHEALALQDAHLPPDHPDTSFTLLALGRTHHEKKEFLEAEVMIRRALEIRTQCFGERSAKAAECQLHLGATLRAKGDPAAAEPVLRACVESYVETLGAAHHNVALVRSELGSCLRDLGRFEQAEQELLGACRALEQKFGEKDARTLRSARALGELYGELGRTREAECWSAAGAR